MLENNRSAYLKRNIKTVKTIDKVDNTKNANGVQCFGCGSSSLRTDPEKGDVICLNCGMIAEESIFFDNKDSVSFSGMAAISPTSPNPGMINREYAQKLKRAEKWAHSWQEIHIVVASKELKRLIAFMELPEAIFSDANVLYMKVLKKNGIQGRGIYAMSAACIYIVCRMQKIPIFFSELVKSSRATQQSNIRKCYNYIMANFNISLPVVQPYQFIPKLISVLGFNQEVEVMSSKILTKIREKNAIDIRINNPKNLAVISIFFAYNILKKKNNNISLTQKEFSKKVDLSETTLRKYRELFKSVVQKSKKSTRRK